VAAAAPPYACDCAHSRHEIAALNREVAALHREAIALRCTLTEAAVDSARILASAKLDADRSAGICSARDLLEACAEEAWCMCLHAHRSCAGVSSDHLAALLDERDGCGGLRAYIRVAAVDNNADPDGVLAAARGLFSTVGTHPRAREGERCIPHEVFGGDYNAHLAFASLVHFSGSNLLHYMAVEDWLPWLVIRALRRCGGRSGGWLTEADYCAAVRLTYSRI
jgi:hypothetical protein